MAGRNHSMKRGKKKNNKSSRAGKTVLLWSKLWLWAKVSTLKVIMFVGRWECGRGVFWDFQSALGWIVSWWIWWKTGGGDVEEGRLSVAVAKMMHLSFSLTSKLAPVTSLFMNTSQILIVLPYFLMPCFFFTALCVAWWVFLSVSMRSRNNTNVFLFFFN